MENKQEVFYILDDCIEGTIKIVQFKLVENL